MKDFKILRERLDNLIRESGSEQDFLQKTLLSTAEFNLIKKILYEEDSKLKKN